MNYFDILLAKKLNSGGGGDITVESLSVTENGTYTAPSGKAYSPVTVAVELPENSYQLKSITTPTSLATFNASAMPMPSLKVSVEAKQDLHGYDKPWVGGAGINILPNNTTDETETRNGITLKKENGVYTLSGTATAFTVFIVPLSASVDLSPSTNKICFLNDKASNVTVGFIRDGAIIHYWGQNPANRVASNWSDTGNEVIDSLRFEIPSGENLNTPLVISPVLMDKTKESVTAFEPYSNVCPISGWDAANVSDVDDIDNPTVTQTTTISLGQTVYGGELDVVNGTSGNKLTHQIETISGGITRTDSSGYLFIVKDLNVPDITNYDTVTPYMESNYLTPYSVNDLRANAVFGFTQYNKRLYIRLGDGITTVEDANAFLASNPLQIKYELATPTTLTTQPTPIKSLNGINNLSVDCGEVIEGEYFIALGGD